MKNRNFLMLFDGPMGSGKSTIARLIKSKLKKTAIIDWDALKETISDYNQASEDKHKLLKVRLALTKIYINNDFNILLDGGFPRNDRIIPFIKLAKQKKLKLLIYQFTAPNKILLKRSLARPKFAWQKKKINKATTIYNLSYYEKHKFKGTVNKVFNSSTTGPQEIIKTILLDI